MANRQLDSRDPLTCHNALFEDISLTHSSSPKSEAGLISKGKSVAVAAFIGKNGVDASIDRLVNWLQTADVSIVSDLDEQTSEMPAILLYDRAQNSVLKGLGQGQGPMEALMGWRTVSEKCLARYRSNRRGTALLDVQSFEENPQSFLQALAKKFDWDLKDLDTVAVSQDVASETAQDEILRVIAAVAVSGDPQARRLEGELEAGSLWLDQANGPALKRADPELALSAYQKTQKRQSADIEAQLQAALLEKTAVMQQLMDTQEELEKFAISAGDQEKSSDREKDLLMQQLSNTQSELETYFDELQKKQKQFGALERELQKKQEQLDGLEIELQSANEKAQREEEESRRKIDTLNDEILFKNGEIEALRNSTSWKVTSPLRGVGDTLKSAKKRG